MKTDMKISDEAKRGVRNLTERFAREVLRGAVEIAIYPIVSATCSAASEQVYLCSAPAHLFPSPGGS